VHFDKRAVKCLFNIFLVMNLTSYFVCAFTPPVQIPKKTDVSNKQYFCVQCNNWKPDRAHHCSICKICVAKMDHHCPWLGNCIGTHNLKSFYLFCFYQTLMGLTYFWRVYVFMLSDDVKVLTMKFNWYENFAYYFTNIFCLLIILALIFHCVNLFRLIYANLTQLERMMGFQMRAMCLETNRKRKLTNKYDMLGPFNLREVFGDAFWKWPLPIRDTQPGRGLYYPKIPDVSPILKEQTKNPD